MSEPHDILDCIPSECTDPDHDPQCDRASLRWGYRSPIPCGCGWPDKTCGIDRHVESEQA